MASLVVADMTFDTIENCTVTNVELFRASEVATATLAGGMARSALPLEIIFDHEIRPVCRDFTLVSANGFFIALGSSEPDDPAPD